MASLHVKEERALNIKKFSPLVMTLGLSTRESVKTKASPAPRARESMAELRRVLERAVDDLDFIAQLTYQGCKALLGYNLTQAEKVALLSGDINWIEARFDKLDD